MRLTARVTATGAHQFSHVVDVDITRTTSQVVSDLNTGVSGLKANAQWCDWRIRPTPQPPVGAPAGAGLTQLLVEIETDDDPKSVSISYAYGCRYAEWQDQGMLKVVNLFERRTNNWWTWTFNS